MATSEVTIWMRLRDDGSGAITEFDQVRLFSLSLW